MMLSILICCFVEDANHSSQNMKFFLLSYFKSKANYGSKDRARWWLLVCACPSGHPKLCGVLPQELSHWFCSQGIWLPSGTTCGSDCYMTCRGSNLYSNLDCSSWPTSRNGFVSFENAKYCVCSTNIFLGLQKMPKMSRAVRCFLASQAPGCVWYVLYMVGIVHWHVWLYWQV